jgi:predicted nucleotidyltransferase
MFEDIEKYLPTWRKRLEEEAAALERRRRAAEEAADRMARILGEEFDAERVYLVGSLLRPEAFGSHSDVDLIVVGLEPARYFKALSRIWKELPKGMEVDLVPFEDADEHLRTLALTEGLLLYDQSRTADSQKRD